MLAKMVCHFQTNASWLSAAGRDCATAGEDDCMKATCGRGERPFENRAGVPC